MATKKETNETIKKRLIVELKALGYKKWKKKDATIQFHSKECGDYVVYIYLSNKIRIFIETKGSGSYYIAFNENSFLFKEGIHGWEIAKLFEKKLKACEFLENDKHDCDECGDDFSLKELRPYKYEGSRIVCDNCHDQLMED